MCEYPPAYTGVVWFAFAFFVLMAALAWIFPGNTNPAILPAVIAVFLGFAGLALVTLTLVSRSTLCWNDEELEGADMTGRRHRFSWQQLARVEYVAAATSIRLWSEDGRRIWVAPLMRGFEEFRKQLAAHCAGQRLTMPEVPTKVLTLPKEVLDDC